MTSPYPHAPVPPPRPGQATTACILSFVGSSLALIGLTVMVFALSNDDFAEQISEGAGASAASDTFVTIMTWLSVVGIVLAIASLVVTSMLMRGGSVARILFTVVAGLGIASSLTFFPVGLLWAGLCVTGIVLVWQRPVTEWIGAANSSSTYR
ncbi:hypothetical protein [Nocardioides sp. R-C-SC26]|uniref:hypothetical protein n=1 Tax=Nocardioides sp. R-C-SC26 TaxID=2870414 RepID=UPI001E320DC3|nr:hypothetical protein [Nocardioides sp. R-C-SC26]